MCFGQDAKESGIEVPMSKGDQSSRVAIVTGAAGQDGYMLTQRLLDEGCTVHAPVRHPEALDALASSRGGGGRLIVHAIDLLNTAELLDLVSSARPEELYNLAGESSVSASFSDPQKTWRTNAEVVAALLECLRVESPHTRFYQASSSEMFGSLPGGSVVHDESSAMNPQSPYAAAKAAAHLLCRSYREAYGVRIACGILFNHESHRRSARFLSRKVVDHVRNLRNLYFNGHGTLPILAMGNLEARRDWGFAPDYVDGIRLILRQIQVRSRRFGGAQERDEGAYYRDYVLGTGQLHAVWQFVDRAFALAGFELEWTFDVDNPAQWGACFRETGDPAVCVDPALLRPADPLAIQADPSSARDELGWAPRTGLDVFLEDMLADGLPLAPERSSTL